MRLITSLLTSHRLDLGFRAAGRSYAGHERPSCDGEIAVISACALNHAFAGLTCCWRV